MAQTANHGPQLTPSPRALQKALLQSAQQAQKLAQAFGKVVPAEKRKTTPHPEQAAAASTSAH